MISTQDGQRRRWQPWYFDQDGGEASRKTRRATSTTGPKQSGAAIQGWQAEVFIPYGMLQPLTNVPPKPGSKWRANLYRMDHDEGRPSAWSWVPVGKSFHELAKFGTLVFE